MCRKERDTTRGSPRSFAAQKALAQDDIKPQHHKSFSRLVSQGRLVLETRVQEQTHFK
jgi:hypothetical protein